MSKLYNCLIEVGDGEMVQISRIPTTSTLEKHTQARNELRGKEDFTLKPFANEMVGVENNPVYDQEIMVSAESLIEAATKALTAWSIYGKKE